jgi:hypothetical protein
MPNAHRVGGEVDALCNRCKLTLAHTILAMVGDRIARVQCNTCGGAHAHRSAPGAAAPRPSRPAASASAARACAPSSRVSAGFEQRLAGRELAQARRYNPKQSFALDEVIEHPTFGYGIVTAVRSDKIEVTFKIFDKTLVHGRGDAPASRPSFERPSATLRGSPDKPMAVEDEEGA